MGASHIPQPLDVAPAANHSLPMLLLRVRETVLLPLRPVFRQFDITEQQARVLIVLSEAGALKMQALAEACCIQPPSLSRIIPKLRTRGWVERNRLEEGDQRRVLVELTPRGHDVATRLVDALGRAHGETTSQIGDAHVRDLSRELETALTALGTPALADMRGVGDDEET